MHKPTGKKVENLVVIICLIVVPGKWPDNLRGIGKKPNTLYITWTVGFLTIIVARVRVKHCNNNLKLLNNMKEIQQKEREAYAQMEKIEKDYI